jgi:hypothetical protein
MKIFFAEQKDKKDKINPIDIGWFDWYLFQNGYAHLCQGKDECRMTYETLVTKEAPPLSVSVVRGP